MMRIGQSEQTPARRPIGAGPVRRRLLFGAALAIGWASAAPAGAQGGAPLKIVVPFPAGGSGDILARVLAEEIGRNHHLTVTVENRPGAGSAIATEAVARADPDGNTLLLNANSFVINASLQRMNYDPLTAFEPVCFLAATPMFIVVPSSAPYRTLADLVAAARARPGAITVASLGPATAQHIAFEILKRRANADLTFVPYGGNVLALNALLGGHVVSVIANYPEVVEQIRAGTLRALATTARERIAGLPDIPTVGESGFEDYSAEVWIGLVAPAKTPGSKLSLLASWVQEALRQPAVEARMSAQGLFLRPLCGPPFRDFIRGQLSHYTQAVRDWNIK